MNIKTRFDVGETVAIIDTPGGAEQYKGMTGNIRGIYIEKDRISYDIYIDNEVFKGGHITTMWTDKYLERMKFNPGDRVNVISPGNMYVDSEDIVLRLTEHFEESRRLRTVAKYAYGYNPLCSAIKGISKDAVYVVLACDLHYALIQRDGCREVVLINVNGIQPAN